MKKQVNPAVAAVVILLLLATAAVWVIRGPAQSSRATVDTGLPPEVAARLKKAGPQPMPPMPMPGGGSLAPGGGAAGAPPGSSGGK